jgi:hypothetical protein
MNFISYDLRVEAPERKVKYLYNLSSYPKEADLWPHVLGSEGQLEVMMLPDFFYAKKCRSCSAFHRLLLSFPVFLSCNQ